MPSIKHRRLNFSTTAFGGSLEADMDDKSCLTAGFMLLFYFVFYRLHRITHYDPARVCVVGNLLHAN